MPTDSSFEAFFNAICSRKPRDCEGVLRGGWKAGLGIYRSGWLYSHCEAVDRVYRSIRAYLGAENLRFFAREFLTEYPPDHSSIDLFGKGFPDFLSGRRELQDRPELFWLATTDWFWHESKAGSCLALPREMIKIWLYLTERPGGDPDVAPDPGCPEYFETLADEEGGMFLVRKAE